MGNGNRLIETMRTQTKRGVRPSFSFSKHAAISLLPCHLSLTLFPVAFSHWLESFPAAYRLLSFPLPPFQTGRDTHSIPERLFNAMDIILVSLIRDAPANHDNAPGRFPFLKSGFGGQKGDGTAQRRTR